MATVWLAPTQEYEDENSNMDLWGGVEIVIAEEID